LVGLSDKPSRCTFPRTDISERFSFIAIKRVGVFSLMKVLSCFMSSFDHD
jgi:hypothetical protein